MEKPSKSRHLHQKTVFCSINSVRALCGLLRIDQRRLQLLAKKPPYTSFTVPKKDGGERIIEAPGPELKRVLGYLNRYLQSAYFFEKSSAAYGFIAGVKNDDDRRNVVTNARKHIGKKYLLNMDLTDFFHAVTKEKVARIFAANPFHFKRDLHELLTDLTTYQGRLPMGTPTSPVLSNFACRDLDDQLQQISADLGWVYTRYADDMSFSSNAPIDANAIDLIRTTIRKDGFEVNERKKKLFGPDDPKIVTGLLVAAQVTLAPEYLPKLEAEIQQLKTILLAQNEAGELATRWVETQKKQVMGRINFAGFVLKRSDDRYIEVKNSYYVAVNPPQEEFGAMSWRGFPYNF